MKIALLSDLHIPARSPIARKDDAVETAFEKLRWIYQYCWDHKVNRILQAGDFFNTPRSWNLMPEALEFFGYWKSKGLETYAVFGQHDTYLYSATRRESTNLGVLAKVGFVNVVNGKTEIANNFFVHGVHWGQPIRQPIPLEGEKHILLAHASIANKAAYPGHDFTPAKKVLKEYLYDLILVGDVHTKFYHNTGGRHIVNTGPMMRLAATEDMFNHEPCFAIWDTRKKNSMAWVNIKSAKPAGEVLTRQHITFKQEVKKVTNDFVNSLQNAGNKVSSNIRKRIEAWLDNNEVNPDVRTLIMLVVEDEDE